MFLILCLNKKNFYSMKLTLKKWLKDNYQFIIIVPIIIIFIYILTNIITALLAFVIFLVCWFVPFR